MTEQTLPELTNQSFKKVLEDRDAVIKSILQQNSELKQQLENLLIRDRMTKNLQVSELRKNGMTKIQQSPMDPERQQQFIILNIGQCNDQIILDQKAKIADFSIFLNHEDDDNSKNDQKQQQQLQKYCNNVIQELEKMKKQLNRQRQIKQLQNDRQANISASAKTQPNLTKKTNLNQKFYNNGMTSTGQNLNKKTNLRQNVSHDKTITHSQKQNGTYEKPQDILVLSKVESHIEQEQENHQQNNIQTNPMLETTQKPKTFPNTPINETPTKQLVVSTHQQYIWQEQQENTQKKITTSPQTGKRKKYKISYIRP